jgi:hypothetical protein
MTMRGARHMNSKLELGAALAALALPANAFAAGPACLTEKEAIAFFSYALPEMLNTVSNRCEKALPSTSYLSTHSKALVANYRATSASAWPQAKLAFFKLGGDDNSDGAKILRAMPDETLKSVVGSAFNVVVGNDIKEADCPRIDSLVEALAPLAISNVATILVTLGGLVESGKNDSFSICPKN